MHLLVTCATQPEINPLLDHLNLLSEIDVGNAVIVEIQNHEIDLFVTGPGINQTAFFLGTQLAKKKYDLCIQAGICGAFDRSLKLGEVVSVKTEEFGQAGAEDGKNFLNLFELGLMGKDDFPYTRGKLVNPHEFKFTSIRAIKQVNSVTVETVHGGDESIEKIIQRSNPAVESMEGAPFFYACLLNKTPFLEIRCISNYVEKRNKANWNIPLAVGELNTVLIQLIEEITT